MEIFRTFSSCTLKSSECAYFFRRLLTCLEDFFGVERLTEKFLHVSSKQEHDSHHSHQHQGEDDAEPNAAVEENTQAGRYRNNTEQAEMEM